MKNKILKAKCIDMTIEGYGVCKVDDLVIFTKGMIVDEVAMIKIISHKKNLAYAIIDEMLEPSPYRVKSICKIAYKCGGCDLRHIDYDFQLKLKQKWVKDTMRNVAGLDIEVKDVVRSPLLNNYRNKVQVPVDDGKLGFYRKNSHDIMEFETCHIQSELSNAILLYLKEEIIKREVDQHFRHILIKHGFKSGEVMVAFITRVDKFKGMHELANDLVKKFPEVKSVILNVNKRNDNVILGDEEIVLSGEPYIYDILDGIKFKISLKSFYQVNPEQTVNLYNEVIERGQIDESMNVLDLYSGIGSISLFLARKAKHVTGVEIVGPAVLNAKDNAKINDINNVDFILSDASVGIEDYLKNQDMVVVDPPRKGLNKKVISEIANTSIPKIVYVSCNPATLARDIAIFNDLGFKADYVRPFDMFPHTTHVESVVVLKR